ncbi:MAG: hypothetical protein WCH99_13280 [Verrucomicrobiota bacterium]
MNSQNVNRASGAAIGFLVVSVIFAVLAVGLKLSVLPPAINADRAAERAKALAEIRREEEKSLSLAATIDSKRGIVRLPIEAAMRLAAQKWKNPAAGRADLNARLQKATVPVKAESFE